MKGTQISLIFFVMVCATSAGATRPGCCHPTVGSWTIMIKESAEPWSPPFYALRMDIDLTLGSYKSSKLLLDNFVVPNYSPTNHSQICIASTGFCFQIDDSNGCSRSRFKYPEGLVWCFKEGFLAGPESFQMAGCSDVSIWTEIMNLNGAGPFNGTFITSPIPGSPSTVCGLSSGFFMDRNDRSVSLIASRYNSSAPDPSVFEILSVCYQTVESKSKKRFQIRTAKSKSESFAPKEGLLQRLFSIFS